MNSTQQKKMVDDLTAFMKIIKVPVSYQVAILGFVITYLQEANK